ncbi:helix-turn-helix domain-containing protein [Streptomyces olivaceiscleroticus]|uniref:Transposase n=1 Tax=Streptomyces olivaceiscleroticus TaxID=68245 RepID=A0ABN1A3Q1_9ACTN
MPVALAYPIVLTASERERLKKMAYGHKPQHRLWRRAQIVQHAARGRCNARIAHETGLHLDTVRAWRGRFAHGGLSALADRKRSGRPARFTPVQITGTKALACQLPAETGVPLSRWTCPELAAELTSRGITDSISASTVCRWLREDVLKPWQYRSWIFSPIPTSAPRPSACWTCTPAPRPRGNYRRGSKRRGPRRRRPHARDHHRKRRNRWRVVAPTVVIRPQCGG